MADENPLGIESDEFEPPEHEVPPVIELDDPYEPEAPELVVWTPERAAAILKGGGFLLHAADPIAREPEAVELWRATEDDVAAMAPPLSRILNRYAPARALAGVSDEAELAFGMLAYAKRNLVTRGRAVNAKRERETPPEDANAPTWAEGEQS
jgi:hypothetical protein